MKSGRNTKITEFPIPTANASPVNIAVGPDGNIWFTAAGKLGRVTEDGAITEFAIPWPNARPTGLTAGSDRRPPDYLTNRLWFADSGANAIGFLSFR